MPRIYCRLVNGYLIFHVLKWNLSVPSTSKTNQSFWRCIKNIYKQFMKSWKCWLCVKGEGTEKVRIIILRAGGSGWGGRWEGGSGWGRHVNPRPFHFNVWQNSLQIKKKKRKKKRFPWLVEFRSKHYFPVYYFWIPSIFENKKYFIIKMGKRGRERFLNVSVYSFVAAKWNHTHFPSWDTNFAVKLF